jgi:hypothetical protein
MASWLNDLYVILSKLSTLDQPRTVAQVRNTVFENLQHDPRYKHVLRDMRQNSKWDMIPIRAKLSAEATSIDDFLPGQHGESDSDNNSGTDDHSSDRLTEKEKTKVLKAALKKKANNTSNCDQESRELSVILAQLQGPRTKRSTNNLSQLPRQAKAPANTEYGTAVNKPSMPMHWPGDVKAEAANQAAAACT